MSENPRTAATTDDHDRNRIPTYVGVIVIEAIVVLGLWIFERYFSA